ncbi:MAG: alpha-N-acetylglucosaminidase C-terminal domain-containing protein [Bacteroidales bacterium]|nr:alpha-N-acetylglucosaminidase C-terminal domain-containing protein [Bacteroidales bacterium]
MAIKAAKGVVTRCFGYFPDNVKFGIIPKRDSCDEYVLSVSGGRLTVLGSSPVALCKGFHDYVFDNGYGIVSWTGNRLDLPSSLPDMPEKKVASPYRHHLYYNVCTYGYTTPFWGWKQWEKEIDWMAMHGFDMPLSPIGGETILARVWKKFGLSDEVINDYFTGPAHFPWMRMGNIAHFQGGMSKEWFDAQIALEHKINDRELALGMTPVYQGFAGFVPKGITGKYPDEKLTETEWSSFDKSCLNHMLSPSSKLFPEMSTAFIREWEKEFGKGTYYLIDSFNEMDIPVGAPGSRDRFDYLRKYGKMIYDSVKDANPDAVWVMQGWILGYQRKIWTPETFASLVSAVPDNKMIIIDLAVDFNQYVWKNARSWDFYKGFAGKEWIWSTVPNFGGKSALEGPLDFYLNDAVNALNSPNRGSLVGFGTSPEGIENNEITYEAISSSGWSSSRRDPVSFLESYNKARYGASPGPLNEFWTQMLQSAYSNFTNGATFAWQRRPPYRKKAPLKINDHYYQAITDFLSVSGSFKDNPLYRNDAIMYGAMYLAGKTDEILPYIYAAIDMGDTQRAKRLEDIAINMLSDMDKLLESHDNMRTQRWLDFAEAAGTNPKESEAFAIEAKRLISTWGGTSLHDYAARIWSGIIRDYYVPRLKYYFDNAIEGKSVDMAGFDESHFPVSPTLSAPSTFPDPVASACELTARYSDIVNEAEKEAKASYGEKPDYYKAEGSLRLMTYNVAHFGKVLRDSSPMIADMANEIGADAIALCETDSCTVRSGDYQVEKFADYLGGWNYEFQRAMPFGGGAYGIGVATKEKILNHFGVILPKGRGAEPRALVAVETPDYIFACTHLDNASASARLAQVRMINKIMVGKYGNSDKPVFLCGDFNDYPGSRVLDEFRKEWKVISSTFPTFDAVSPSYCIDYILVLDNEPECRSVKSYVCNEFKSGDVKTASDHLPVFADVALE